MLLSAHDHLKTPTPCINFAVGQQQNRIRIKTPPIPQSNRPKDHKPNTLNTHFIGNKGQKTPTRRCRLKKNPQNIEFQCFAEKKMWSWRESNPRPNKAFKSFLHAQTPKYCREETTVGDPQSLSLVPYLRPVAEPNRQHPDGLMSQSGEIGRPSGGTAYC